MEQPENPNFKNLIHPPPWLCVTLGAFTTSPNESLYIEAHEPPYTWDDINLHSNTISNSSHVPKTLPITS